MGQSYQQTLYHVARCQTCKTEDQFFVHWDERDHWQHDEHAGHHVATWLELR